MNLGKPANVIDTSSHLAVSLALFAGNFALRSQIGVYGFAISAPIKWIDVATARGRSVKTAGIPTPLGGDRLTPGCRALPRRECGRSASAFTSRTGPLSRTSTSPSIPVR